MDLQHRHQPTVEGDGPATLLFVHGFGCDQGMWRFLVPHYAQRFRTVRYDLVGGGRSDLSAYDRDRYATLHGHADDLVAVARAYGRGPVVLVAHSVSAMIGLLAGLQAPGLFAAQAWLGPSPCYINDGDYLGGFARADIDALLEALDSNYLGWASATAPAIMSAPGQPQLGEELTNSFCRTDPDIARHFARVTFLSDHRADLSRLQDPTLVLQCSDDFIAPRTVGEFIAAQLPNPTLRIIENVGHCPHLSAPCDTITAIDGFLAGRGLDRAVA